MFVLSTKLNCITRFIAFLFAIALVPMGLAAFGQTLVQIHELASGQTIERELTGGETHRYKFDLQQDEFFQVRVEQKGVDVALKLLDANGKVLATMDSPNGKEGPERLTWVADKPGSLVLEVSGLDPKAEKGKYSIRREESRAATARDKRRVEVERSFAQAIADVAVQAREKIALEQLAGVEAGWEELGDKYLSELSAQLLSAHRLKDLNAKLQMAEQTSREGQKLSLKSTSDIVAGRNELEQSLKELGILKSELADKALLNMIGRSGAKSDELTSSLRDLEFWARVYEGLSFDAIALSHQNVSEWQKDVDYRKLAIGSYDDVVQSFKDLNGSDRRALLSGLRFLAASALLNMGQSLKKLGERAEALDRLNQARERFRGLYQENPDPKFKLEEAVVLEEIGLLYTDESRSRHIGIGFLEKAIEIFRSLPDRKRDMANLMGVIGAQQMLDVDYESSLTNWDSALKIYRELKDPIGEMDVLRSKGTLYFILDDGPKVKENFSQALAILQSSDFAKQWKRSHPDLQSPAGVFDEVMDNTIEYLRLDEVGYCYERLEDYPSAIQAYEKALVIARSKKELNDIRSQLRSIGYNYAKLEKWDKASEYYLQALEISRQNGVREDIASDLADVGWALMEGGKAKDALSYQNDAMNVFHSIGVGKAAFSLRYVRLFHEIARNYAALNNRSLAIFYGKLGVNAVQGERERLRKLDAVSQKGFLRTQEKHYRRLADWLIAEGRLPEAEQVMGMLKDNEYTQYLRRDYQAGKDLLFTVSLKPGEADSAERYDQFANRLTTIGKEYGELESEKKKPEYENRPFPRQARLDELEKMLNDAGIVSQKFLDELEQKFKQHDDRVAEIKSGFQSMLKDMNAKHTVVVSTIVDDDRLTIFITTADSQRAHAVDIKAADVNRLVSEFRAAVTNPKIDPHDAGRKLYDIVIAPIEKDLAGINADTIVWSLDGALRYAPMAALWDGQHYLAERYANVVITLASQKYLEQAIADKTKWRALAVGVSKGSEAFAALQAVPDELDCVVTDPINKTVSLHPQCQKGVLNGTKLLDDRLTKESFRNALGRYAVVHVASHFNLQPGDAYSSFLLLGGGATEKDRKLMVSEINHSLFSGVEILTLSACNTAVGTEKSNGLEIEGFGAMAQREGAKSVIATLWEVADPSTRDFMVKFYSLYDSPGSVNKAQALRQAQLALLRGGNKIDQPSNTTRSSIRLEADNTNGTFTSDPKAKYSHPYYWAPFILIGNWK